MKRRKDFKKEAEKMIRAKEFKVISDKFSGQWVAFDQRREMVLVNGQTLESVASKLTASQLASTLIFRVLPRGLVYSPNQS